MIRLCTMTLAIALAGCAARVSHPTKTLAEQQVDIDLCTDQANRKYWMDPVAALLNAYDCLEAKGYKRGQAGMAAKVKEGVDARRPQGSEARPPEVPKPCRVPCKQ
jgi:hypothetical protein